MLHNYLYLQHYCKDMKFLSGFFLLLISFYGLSQNDLRLIIVNNDSVPLPFAEVYIEEYGHSFYANEQGEVKMPLREVNTLKLQVRSDGYKTKILDFSLNQPRPYVVLEELHRHLDKVIVSSETGIQRESITNISRQEIKDISVIKNESLGEALANIPGVEVTGIGSGMSKPVIRGLSGASVVTYVNGLRIENQQWGGDHGLPITSLGIGSVEVVRGPSSLLYGADAMGGVLYFRDEPFADLNTQNGYVSTRFDANTLGANVNVGYQISKDNWHVSAYGGYDDYADYKLPNGNVILNSRFRQQAGKLVFGYHKKKWLFRLNYDYYGGRLGLPGHTHEADPSPSDFETTSQTRGLNAPAQVLTNHFVSTENQFFLKKSTLTFILGNTNNLLEEHEDKIFTPDIVMNLNNSLYHVKWNYRLSKKLNILAGSQGMYQMNRNGSQAIEFLIPDANTLDLGGYLLLNYKLLKWRFQAGGRFDNRSIEGFKVDKFDAFNREFSGFNFSSGAAYISQKMTFRLNLSSGFRAPTSSELLSNGLHHGSNRYEIGNINLKAENAVQVDGSIAFHFDDLELILNPFYNRVLNYIYIEPTNTIIDNFQVFNYQQADFAELMGTDFGFHYHPHQFHWLHLESSFSGIYAQDDEGVALPLIPQTSIRNQVGIHFNMSSKFELETLTLQYQYYFAQNRVGLYDTPSNDYGLLNVNLSSRLNSKIPVFVDLGARNLLNNSFISHLSNIKYLGIMSPGRNIYLSLKIEFNQSISK